MGPRNMKSIFDELFRKDKIHQPEFDTMNKKNNRQTDTTENSTFPQLHCRVVIRSLSVK